jgi:hypothetical protein
MAVSADRTTRVTPRRPRANRELPHLTVAERAARGEEFLAPSEFENHGERVVTGQRLMQASSDILIGWYASRREKGACPATSSAVSSRTGRARRKSREWCPGQWRSTASSG